MGEAYTSEAKSWSDTQLWVGRLQGPRGGSLSVWAEGQVCSYGGSEVRWDRWLPGKPVEDMPLTSSLIGNQVEMS